MNQLFRLSSEILDSVELEDVEKTYTDMFEMKINYPPFKAYSIEISSKFLSKLGEKLCDYHKNKNYWPTNFSYGLFIEYFEFEKNEKGYLKFSEFLKDDLTDKIIPEDNKVCTMNINFLTKDGRCEAFDNYIAYRKINGKSDDETEKYKKIMGNIGSKLRELLIVLLATKNHIIEQKKDKDLARGRFNKKQAYRKDYPITTTIVIGKITETYESKGGIGSAKRPHMRRGHIRTQHYGPKNELTQKIFIQPVFVNADEGWISERKAYNIGV